MDKVQNYGARVTIIGFLTALLIFSANNDFTGSDLIDTMTDYVDAQTQLTKQEVRNLEQ